MPSKFEPCGLSQMIASRYGTVPIVRETGGLYDTIVDYYASRDGNGFTFKDYSSYALYLKGKDAVELYRYHYEEYVELVGMHQRKIILKLIIIYLIKSF